MLVWKDGSDIAEIIWRSWDAYLLWFGTETGLQSKRWRWRSLRWELGHECNFMRGWPCLWLDLPKAELTVLLQPSRVKGFKQSSWKLGKYVRGTNDIPQSLKHCQVFICTHVLQSIQQYISWSGKLYEVCLALQNLWMSFGFLDSEIACIQGTYKVSPLCVCFTFKPSKQIRSGTAVHSRGCHSCKASSRHHLSNSCRIFFWGILQCFDV